MPPWTKASLPRSVVSIASYFRVPEQGMKEYELLSRGTACCLHRSPSNASGRLVLVTCSHVLAPYKWRQHFKEPWLAYLDDKHVECRVQVWKNGAFGAEVPLRGVPTTHPTLDLCVLPVDQGTAVAHALQALERRETEDPLHEAETVTCLGFPTGERLEALPPREVQGQALARIRDKEGRGYARMEDCLAVGMSGGPVLDAQGRFCGVFQGILPPLPQTPEEEAADDLDPVLHPLRQEKDCERHAGYIPMTDVHDFLATQ